MNSFLPKQVRQMIEELAKLPGIGPKSAQRLTIYLLNQPDFKLKNLSSTVANLKIGLHFCNICWQVAEEEVCEICANSFRNKNLICVVEDVLDVLALEKTAQFKGLYHVLHGVLSPIDGIGPEELKMDELKIRVEKLLLNNNSTEIEIIVATNPSLEGETTALFIARLLKPLKIKVSRIGRGLPAGGDLDYADEVTLTRALIGRTEY